jgi:hypothetical protein
MTKGHREQQYATPLFIDEIDDTGTVRRLERLDYSGRGSDGKSHNEKWLQDLIQKFPQSLPIQEIEPGLSDVIPVCLELPTPAGPADNFFVTSRGDLILVECKLWRNPEARREVVAQIIDYAHAMAKWTYEDLEAAIRRGDAIGGGKVSASLYEIVGDENELDESNFTDAVSRNLRLGRILLLIVGDGIREGVESLADYLQMHAGFHFTLGVVEMPIVQLPTTGYVVMPRILARTINIERGIVKVTDEHVSIEPPQKPPSDRAQGRATSMSRERFMEELEKSEPGLPTQLDAFLDRAEEHGVFPQFAKSLLLKWRSPDGKDFNVGYITIEGNFRTEAINWTPDSLGLVHLAQEYQDVLAQLIGANVRQTPNPNSWYLVTEGTTLPKATTMLARQTEWISAIEAYTSKLAEALDR